MFNFSGTSSLWFSVNYLGFSCEVVWPCFPTFYLLRCKKLQVTSPSPLKHCSTCIMYRSLFRPSENLMTNLAMTSSYVLTFVMLFSNHSTADFWCWEAKIAFFLKIYIVSWAASAGALPGANLIFFPKSSLKDLASWSSCILWMAQRGYAKWVLAVILSKKSNNSLEKGSWHEFMCGSGESSFFYRASASDLSIAL